MQLLLLIVALGTFTRIDAHAIAYPYRTELLSYAPARGQFPVQNGVAQGFVRYLDSDGTQRLVGYSYPEPLYGVRSSSSSTGQQSQQPLLKASTEELEKAQLREQHFREWCQQRYAALKSETERLQAEGKQPSQNMLAQLKPLETMLSGADGAYSETPELQQEREEHFRIWNEARLKVLQQQEEHLKLNVAQTSSSAQQSPSHLRAQDAVEAPVAVSETAEQQKAREEHLRIYQEHLQRVQQLQTSAQTHEAAQQNEDNEAIEIKAAAEEHKIVEHLNQLQETPEVLRAKQEHLRLWSEAKLRAEQAEKQLQQHRQQQQQQVESAQSDASHKATLYSASRTGLVSEATAAPHVPAQVQDTAEVQRAREQHLRIVQQTQQQLELVTLQQREQAQQTAEGNALVRLAAASPQLAAVQAQPLAQPLAQQQTQQQQTTSSAFIPKATPLEATQSVASPQDTPEVQRAREAHLQLVNEATLKAAQYNSDQSELLSKASPQPILYVAKVSDEKAALLKAAELLRVEEAKQRETERLLDQTRLKEEERMQIAEHMRLQEEEQQRQTQERIEEAKQREETARWGDKATQLTQQQESSQHQRTQVKTQVLITLPSATHDLREEQRQYGNNPFLLHLAVPSAGSAGVGVGIDSAKTVASTGAYYIGENQQKQLQYASPGYYYVHDTNSGLVKLDNPYFIRHLEQSMKQATAQPLEKNDAVSVSAVDTTAAAPQQTVDAILTGRHLQSITPAPAVAAALMMDPGADAGFAAWQKATREHYRAHEMALEQLNFAGSNSAAEKENCN